LQLDNFPFGLAEILAGLRQYLGASGLNLVNIKDMPLPAVMPGSYGNRSEDYKLCSLIATVELNNQQHRLALTLNEAPFLSIQCEHGLYRYAEDIFLPLLVPGFVAGNAQSGWMVLEGLDDLRPPQDWENNDYREAIQNLALLHDRFWGLEEDLENFDWLGRPLDRDFPAIQKKVSEAVNTLTQQKPHSALDTHRYHKAFITLEEHLSRIVNPLRTQTPTLVHGTYWAGNIAQPLDGRQIVTHWQYAAIGPAILDLVTFHQSTVSHLQPSLPVEAALALYQVQIKKNRGKQLWTEDEWEMLWDYALMWLFAFHWLKRLADMPPTQYTKLHDKLETYWLNPVLKAIERQLNITLPN